jgi:hypothetical protein
VTPLWLEACLQQKARAYEGDFTPEVAKSNETISQDDIHKFRRTHYNVKRGLFKNNTFAINEDAYLAHLPHGSAIEKPWGEFDTGADMIEHMARLIIENGGKVVDITHKSNYVITDDGTIPDIWEKVGQGASVLDKLNRKVIHFRWILACIEKNKMIEDSETMHLLPLPHRVPIP